MQAEARVPITAATIARNFGSERGWSRTRRNLGIGETPDCAARRSAAQRDEIHSTDASRDATQRGAPHRAAQLVLARPLRRSGISGIPRTRRSEIANAVGYA